jgi:hypothetical protein
LLLKSERAAHSITSGGTLLEMERHVEAERFCGLELMTNSNLVGQHRKVGRLGALEDAIALDRRTPIIIEHVISVGQQAAEFTEETERIDGRETVAGRQRCDLRAMGPYGAA